MTLITAINTLIGQEPGAELHIKHPLSTPGMVVACLTNPGMVLAVGYGYGLGPALDALMDDLARIPVCPVVPTAA